MAPGDQWRPFPADSMAFAQQLPPPRHWIGYLAAPGTSFWGPKYWMCFHDHFTGDEAIDVLATSAQTGSGMARFVDRTPANPRFARQHLPVYLGRRCV
jgi:hypothetical protein